MKMTVLADVRHTLPAARDQGSRPTCLAFAISDAHQSAAGLTFPLSPECLHYFATQRSGSSLNGPATVEDAAAALRLEGQPTENSCPYSEARAENWSPPADVGDTWTRKSEVSAVSASRTAKGALLNGRAHILVIQLSRSFYTPDVATHFVHEDGSLNHGLHAVVAVAVAETTNNAAFLVRNSWGSNWGTDGHAWLSSEYLDQRVVTIILLERRCV